MATIRLFQYFDSAGVDGLKAGSATSPTSITVDGQVAEVRRGAVAATTLHTLLGSGGILGENSGFADGNEPWDLFYFEVLTTDANLTVFFTIANPSESHRVPVRFGVPLVLGSSRFSDTTAETVESIEVFNPGGSTAYYRCVIVT